MTQPLHILSLGAGVQSTTMALMAAHGEIEPMPDAAIFADTGWEPARVYEHLRWLQTPSILPFPVHVVSNGNIRDMLVREERGRYVAVPFFLGNGGMGRRQCTHEFKLKPLKWRMRELLGKGRKERIPPGSVVVWLGISTDEAVRMKPADVLWQNNRWPLIEKGMSRGDCYGWLESRGYRAPPKSSCVGCPYHSNAHWRDMQDNAPHDWADAVRVDKIIRYTGTLRNARHQQYMHAKRIPLDEVDLRTLEDRGQLNLFANECTGMCGT